MTDAIQLSGAAGSPYTRKMLAVLRYRRIPYRFIVSGHGGPGGLPRPKVELLPTFYLPDAEGTLQAVVDSTPIIRRLEAEHQGREVVPPSPALRFIDELLEDYADEWLTKAMFHYRWRFRADIDKAATMLPLWRNPSMPGEMLAKMQTMIGERQIARLYVVGSNDTTAPVIEQSYERLLALLEAHIARHRFLMGGRPGSSDFAVYGQLTQLTHFDPTPMAVCVDSAPRVYGWVDMIEDMSGLEPEAWASADDLPQTLTAILAEASRTYVPAMLANASAIKAGAAQVETEIDGLPWVQQPFPYQAKCLGWLRQSFATLPDADRALVDGILHQTGCAPLIHAAI